MLFHLLQFEDYDDELTPEEIEQMKIKNGDNQYGASSCYIIQNLKS